MRQLAGVERDQGRAKELQDILSLIATEADQRAARAGEQFRNFSAAGSRKVFGRDELYAQGLNDEILRLIEQDYGLSGDKAAQALQVARQLAARQQAYERLGPGLHRKAEVPFVDEEEAYEVPDSQGDYHRVDPLVEQIADALFERFRRDREGPSQSEQTARVVHHHHHTTIERMYAPKSSIRGGRSPAGDRDRGGRN